MFAKYGSSPKLEEKTSIVNSLHELFSHISTPSLHKKMLQWTKNKKRPPKRAKMKVRKRPKIEAIDQSDGIMMVTEQNNVEAEYEHVTCMEEYLHSDEIEDEEVIECGSGSEVEEYITS